MAHQLVLHNADIDEFDQITPAKRNLARYWLSDDIALSKPLLEDASSLNCTGLVQWLCHADRGESRLKPDKNTLLGAFKFNNIGLAKWLCSLARGEDQLTPDYEDLYIAAWSGNIDVVQWLCSDDQGEPLSDLLKVPFFWQQNQALLISLNGYVILSEVCVSKHLINAF